MAIDPQQPTQPGPTPPAPNIEDVLARQANAAMAAGANPQATTMHLRQMIQHLRANPGYAQQATNAIAHGGDANAISQKISEDAKGVAADGSTAPKGFVPSMIDAASFGIVPKLAAGLDAVQRGVRAAAGGGSFSGTATDTYLQDQAAQRGTGEQYHAEHPYRDDAAQILGGVAGVLATDGLGAGAEAANVPRVLRYAKTIGQGAKYGAVSALGHSDALETGRGASGLVNDTKRGVELGAVGGAVSIPATAAAGNILAATPIPRLANAAAAKLAGVAPMFGPEGAANAVIAKRAAMDEAGGFSPSTLPTSKTLPFLALDKAGPNVEGLAEGIANKQGPGRATIVTALSDRAQQMRPAIGNAWTDATGVTAADGEKLIQQLATEQAQRESAANVAGAVAKEAKAPGAPTHTPLEAWEEEVGPQQKDAVQVMSEMDKSGRAKMGQMYGAARAATQGQPMQSETLNAVQETPVGKLAFAWARAQKGNRNSPLPTVGGSEVVPPGFTAETWAKSQANMAERGLPVESFGTTGGQEVPDPEMLHYAKQYLAKLARLGTNDGAQGTLATQAQGALQQWGKIRGELPPIWQQADEAAAEHFGRMDALNAGRNIMRTQLSPAGAPRKAIAQSLQGVEERLASYSQEQQYAFRTGARSAVNDYLKTASPDKVLEQLQDPTSALSRRVVLATGDNDAPSRLASRLQPQPQQIPGAPSVPVQSAESQAASRGRSILTTTKTATNPANSLPALAQDFSNMSVGERAALGRGAATGIRGEFQGTSGNLKSPGRVFDFNSPERSEQISYAIQNPAAQKQFADEIAAWDRAQQQTERITGNSRTALRSNETGNGGLVSLKQMIGSPTRMIRQAVGKLQSEYEAGQNQKVDAAIAKALTSNDPNALSRIAQAGVTRTMFIQALQRAFSGAGGELAARR